MTYISDEALQALIEGKDAEIARLQLELAQLDICHAEQTAVFRATITRLEGKLGSAERKNDVLRNGGILS